MRGEVKLVAKDPVCGMDVDEKKAADIFEYRGVTYYFCSRSCKKSFRKEPRKYRRRKAEMVYAGDAYNSHG